MRPSALGVVLASVAWAPGAHASAAPGAQLAGACAACHRLDGRDTGIPPVVGLDAAAITQAMLAYRSGDRPSQIMHVVANALSPEEIAVVARYLATLKPGAGR